MAGEFTTARLYPYSMEDPKEDRIVTAIRGKVRCLGETHMRHKKDANDLWKLQISHLTLRTCPRLDMRRKALKF